MGKLPWDSCCWEFDAFDNVNPFRVNKIRSRFCLQWLLTNKLIVRLQPLLLLQALYPIKEDSEFFCGLVKIRPSSQ